MPDANIIYEGTVRVFTENKDGVAYTIKNGKRAGQAYSRLSFTPEGGDTIYLADFGNDAIKQGVEDGSTAKVAYALKLDDFGDPELYQGNQQYQLQAIKLVGEPQTQQNGQPTGSVGSTPSKPPFDAGLSAKQTSANDATQILVAYLKDPAVYDDAALRALWTGWFNHIHDTLTGVNELDKALDAAKDSGFVVGESSATDPDDEDIPF